ncbi:MAG: 6-pyruvoyl tetrahydropterin synthase family protein [Gemmatimonadota bacterium]
MSQARLTRVVEFPAGHRYFRPEWTEQENAERFGKCSAAPGHGHNYRCEITVEGEIAPETGMVIDLVRLDALLARWITEPMDHAFLNDLPEFAADSLVPTSENLARVIWRRLAPVLPSRCTLRVVRVCEDSSLWAEYRGS